MPKCVQAYQIMLSLSKMDLCRLVGEKEDIVDRLLMRCLPKISGKSVFAGDVVAFKPPPGVDGDLLIRRVAAVEGEEMISDDPEDEAFHLKPGTFPCLCLFTKGLKPDSPDLLIGLKPHAYHQASFNLAGKAP